MAKFKFAVCPSRIHEHKTQQIKAIFNAICTDAFREARDRRMIDDLELDWPGQVLGTIYSTHLSLFI